MSEHAFVYRARPSYLRCSVFIAAAIALAVLSSYVVMPRTHSSQSDWFWFVGLLFVGGMCLVILRVTLGCVITLDGVRSEFLPFPTVAWADIKPFNAGWPLPGIMYWVQAPSFLEGRFMTVGIAGRWLIADREGLRDALTKVAPPDCPLLKLYGWSS